MLCFERGIYSLTQNVIEIWNMENRRSEENLFKSFSDSNMRCDAILSINNLFSSFEDSIIKL